MIAYSSFQRHFNFYSSMDNNQLMKAYSKAVNFSPARIMQAYMQTSYYSRQPPDTDDIMEELLKGLSLMLNGRVSQQLLAYCIEDARPRSRSLAALAAMTSAELVRTGPLKYMVPLTASPRAPRHRRVTISMATIAWRRELQEYNCICGVWDQACEALSSASPNLESTLVIQDEVTPCLYICTLLCISPPPGPEVASASCDTEDKVDYRYIFRDLLIRNMEDHTTNRRG